jgi:hypothetical protein
VLFKIKTLFLRIEWYVAATKGAKTHNFYIT